MDTKSNKDLGTKLLNELMVDIIGALIPGFLFIIVIVVSIVIPCLIYCGPLKYKQFAGLTGGGFWWVLLIACIIFSYVVGHIFYRADITLPDKLDADKQIKRFINYVKKQNYDKATLVSLLKKEITILRDRPKTVLDNKCFQEKFNDHLTNACDSMLDKLKKDSMSFDCHDADFLTILFPEDTIFMKEDDISYSNLSQSSKDVINEYEKYFDISDGDFDPQLKYLLIFYCILHCQMDIGCAIFNRCEFPYTNYYKYLIKRNMCDLLEYVNWFTPESRSKNQINSLKIQIQIFANETYALINKNESHIRMSSSTWHISRLLMFVTGLSTLAFIITPIFIAFSCSAEITSARYMAFLLPFAMFLLVIYIRRSILKFIHYQRMREIQYTLQIYHQVKDIIKYRKKKFQLDNNKSISSIED